MASYYRMVKGDDLRKVAKKKVSAHVDNACMVTARNEYNAGKHICVIDMETPFPYKELNSAIRRGSMFMKNVMKPTVSSWIEEGVALMSGNTMLVDLRKVDYKQFNSYMSFNRIFTEFDAMVGAFIQASSSFAMEGHFKTSSAIVTEQIMSFAGRSNREYANNYINGHTPWNGSTTVASLYAMAQLKPLPRISGDKGYDSYKGANDCWNAYNGDRRLAHANVRLSHLTDKQRHKVRKNVKKLVLKHW